MSEWQEAVSIWWEVEGLLPPLGLSMGIMASLCVSMWLVDLFSTGAGFGIYLNHRTWVEGWDVELAFRRMANRLNGVTGLLVMVILAWSVMVVSANEETKKAIHEVLAHQDFEIHTETIREPQLWNLDWLEKLFGSGSAGGSGMEALAVLMKVSVFGVLDYLGL